MYKLYSSTYWRNTQNNRYFMLTCENEQFNLLGPFSLNALVKGSLNVLVKMTVYQ